MVLLLKMHLACTAVLVLGLFLHWFGHQFLLERGNVCTFRVVPRRHCRQMLSADVHPSYLLSASGHCREELPEIILLVRGGQGLISACFKCQCFQHLFLWLVKLMWMQILVLP